MKNQSVKKNLDWICIIIYSVLVILGLLNIYSSSLSSTDDTAMKQLLFIVLSIPLIFVLLAVDGKVYEKYASVIYIIGLLALAGLFVFGKTIKGQANWYSFGSFGIQPSEFVKSATSLALAKYLSDVQVNLKDTNRQIQVLGILGLPILLIVPHDPGSALIYCVLILVLYREGLPAWYVWTAFAAIILFVTTLIIEPIYIILSILVILIAVHFKSRIGNRNVILSSILFVLMSAFVLSVDYVFNNVFKQHHRDRFNILLGKAVDLKGIGYNTNQSEIAIGSGGWFGKGFLEGTQTKGGFVPEQHTDYIFTTVGEEWGFVGSLVLISLFVTLLLRIIYLAERQKTKFSRVYGYCVASILFVHFFVNIAMVAGIFPTIGVPLPFFSYGGSGLWGFTILLFIFLKMDANKVNEW
ncbi:rod shape-determining protein RodA [Flavobacterium sp. UMI-01]|uniref:rod shape-determining protein RodA n=1 Tax=Flavobacterium sp. UMI-01 TaxID=1441053 RepID=UPI001C7D2671|nr:rod shape-determining protein RodA [Flavobacterium sp. UMI-01]GIZ09095.1 rod shape-determining protein RodA [Flavobacterium sp. UMI-01]